MALPDDRLQQLIEAKQGGVYPEGWAIIDGALVIYDFENPPAWFPKDRDEDGNSV